MIPLAVVCALLLVALAYLALRIRRAEASADDALANHAATVEKRLGDLHGRVATLELAPTAPRVYREAAKPDSLYLDAEADRLAYMDASGESHPLY